MLRNDIIDKFITRLNDTDDVQQMNLYSKQEYEDLLRVVLEVLNENKDASINEIREELFKRSGLEQLLTDFYLRDLKAPGAVLSFGTSKYQEQIVIGNKQEVDMNSGSFKINLQPNEADTIYDLASVTKLFTAVSILQLAGKSELSIADKASKYLPEFKNLGNITIYDLLTYVPLITRERIDSAHTIDEAESYLFSARPKTRSEAYGTDRYNDIAPMILKYIVEKVTGIPFDQYVKENILEKAGMNNTFVKVPSYKLNKVANNNYPLRLLSNGSVSIDQTIPIGNASDKKAVALGQPEGILPGHAGLFSTSEDMTKFSKGIISGLVLHPALTKEMAKNRTLNDTVISGNIIYNPSYGFLCNSKNHSSTFTDVFPGLSGRSFSQSGWSGTYVAIDPVNDINLSLLSNRTHNRVINLDPTQSYRLRGTGLVDTSVYGFERRKITDACMKLALQEKMLEELLKDDIVKEDKPKKRILR